MVETLAAAAARLLVVAVAVQAAAAVRGTLQRTMGAFIVAVQGRKAQCGLFTLSPGRHELSQVQTQEIYR